MKENKTLVLMAGFIGMLFFGVAFTVMGAILPSLSESLNLNTAQSSTLVGLLPLGILLGSLIFGVIIDRYGYKSLMVIATLLCLIGLEMLAFVSDVSMIRLSIFILGTSGGMLNGATNALVSDTSSDHSRPANLSLLGFFYCLGAFTIPFLLASLSKSISYTPIVSGTGVIMFIAAIFFLIIKFPEAKYKQGIPVKKVISMAKEPLLLIMSFVLFFQSGLEGVSQNWTPTYLTQHHGMSLDQAQYALSFIVVGMGISRLLLIYLLKKFSSKNILVISMLFALMGVITILLSKNSTIALLGATLLGMGLASTFPVILGRVGERYKEMSGTAFSFALVIALVGNTSLNFLLGALGIKTLPYVLIGAILAIVLISFVGFSKKS